MHSIPPPALHHQELPLREREKGRDQKEKERPQRPPQHHSSSSPSPISAGKMRPFFTCLITASLPITILLIIFVFSTCTTPAYSQAACKNTCGSIPVRYPFGTGPGCGSPQFQRYVACDPQQQVLTFTTHTGAYPVQSVDYDNQVLYVRDPSMSSCACTAPSAGFGLDWDAPFAFASGSVFVLLGCSPSTISPEYTNSSDGGGPLCDRSNSPLCSLLYSCPAVGEQLGDPVSTCCVYAPVSLGPSFDIDLKKLQCGAYAGIYSFGGQEGDPRQWKFGIAVKYRFSVDSGFPRACADCERSNGVCGYTGGELEAFTCNCPNGINTTSDCFFMASYHSGSIESAPRLAMGFLLIIFSLMFLRASPRMLQ